MFGLCILWCLLDADKQYAQAAEVFKKVLEVGPSKTDLYKELAGVYESAGDYGAAAQTYHSFLEKVGEDVKAADCFQAGKCYYYAGGATQGAPAGDPLKRNEYLLWADAEFARVATDAPQSYLGSFWRARVNSVRDPETTAGLAKPYYETAAALLEKDGQKNVKQLIECYSYLGYYYYINEDIPAWAVYWKKILSLDPVNEVAKRALEGIK